MISCKEIKIYDVIEKKYNHKNYPNMNYRKDGRLDMRYSENVKIFVKEYKKYMLIENRKYNNICNGPNDNYREDILKLTDKEILDFHKKIEII